MKAGATIAACALVGGLAFAGAPAFAQHARLEEAWTLCAAVSRTTDLRAALASQAPAAGFPLSRDAMHALRDANGMVLVLSIEVYDGEQQCTVTSNGGDEAAMVARAEGFWPARGYETYASSDPAKLYAAYRDDNDGLGVWLKAAKHAGFWQMTVTEEW